MKKLLIKLATFAIMITMLNTSISLATGSSSDLARYDKLDFAKNAPCIEDTGENAKDAGFLVTFIEEPLDANDKEETNAEGEVIFKQKICYRHTLQWEDEILGVQTLEELSTAPCKTRNELGINEQDKYSCRQIQAVLSKGGTSLIYGYIGMVYRWGASIVGIIAVLVIVISGIQISAAGGDPEAINEAKKRIIQSIAGIAMLFLSGLILYTINPTFFTN